jgi:hypothetical protein
MILMEVAYDSRNRDLDYLAEYLITKREITLTEAKELIVLIEKDEESTIKKIKDAANKKITSLKAWYKTKVAAAKAKYTGSRLKMMLDTIKKQYMKNLEKIKTEMATANKNVWSRTGKMKSSVKAAYRTIPKKGKIGIAAAGLAGLGSVGGYAAYKKSKKK